MSLFKNIMVLIGLLVLAGLISVGMMLAALWLAINMTAPLPVEAYRVDIKPVSSLEVVYNYSEQKTADISVIEPKVSDVYYQNTAGNTPNNRLQGAYNQ
jgi:hypothetical protein